MSSLRELLGLYHHKEPHIEAFLVHGNTIYIALADLGSSNTTQYDLETDHIAWISSPYEGSAEERGANIWHFWLDVNMDGRVSVAVLHSNEAWEAAIKLPRRSKNERWQSTYGLNLDALCRLIAFASDVVGPGDAKTVLTTEMQEVAAYIEKAFFARYGHDTKSLAELMSSN